MNSLANIQYQDATRVRCTLKVMCVQWSVESLFTELESDALENAKTFLAAHLGRMKLINVAN